MGKQKILLLSIVITILGGIYLWIPQLNQTFNTIRIVSVVSAVILWFVLCSQVYTHAVNSGRSGAYVLMPLFLDALGGFIYYGLVYKEDDPQKKEGSTLNAIAKKYSIGFNIAMAIIFGLATLFSIKSKTVMPILFGILFMFSVFAIIHFSKKK